MTRSPYHWTVAGVLLTALLGFCVLTCAAVVAFSAYRAAAQLSPNAQPGWWVMGFACSVVPVALVAAYHHLTPAARLRAKVPVVAGVITVGVWYVGAVLACWGPDVAMLAAVYATVPGLTRGCA